MYLQSQVHRRCATNVSLQPLLNSLVGVFLLSLQREGRVEQPHPVRAAGEFLCAARKAASIEEDKHEAECPTKPF